MGEAPEGALVYLTRYTDETMPCAPTLESWAAWLANPDSEIDEGIAPAADGEVFETFSMIELGDVRVEFRDEVWQAVEPVPVGAAYFYLRWSQGSAGWDVEFAAETIADATDGLEADDSPVWFACVKDGPSGRVRFVAGSPPRLEWVRSDG